MFYSVFISIWWVYFVYCFVCYYFLLFTDCVLVACWFHTLCCLILCLGLLFGACFYCVVWVLLFYACFGMLVCCLGVVNSVALRSGQFALSFITGCYFDVLDLDTVACVGLIVCVCCCWLLLVI